MYFNRTLLFSIALCVASALASSVPLEARTLKGRAGCVGKTGACDVALSPGQCCKDLTCKEVVIDPKVPEKKGYVVFDPSAA